MDFNKYNSKSPLMSSGNMYDPDTHTVIPRPQGAEAFSMVAPLNLKYSKKKNRLDPFELMHRLPAGARGLFILIKGNMMSGSNISCIPSVSGNARKEYYKNVNILFDEGVVRKVSSWVFLVNPDFIIPKRALYKEIKEYWDSLSSPTS
jgi:hypothetical protein